MKITALRTFLVPPRWLFLKIETDEAISGWGEPIVEGRAATVAAAVDELSDYLIGADPLRIEDHWQALTKGGFYRGGPVLSSAVAGIDQALWDIAGRARGLPVHALLGGPVRDRIRVYAWIHGDEPAALAGQARARAAAGYSAVKMTPTEAFGTIETPRAAELLLERVAAVREVLGPDRDLALDFHGRVSPAMARRLLPRLEPFSPLFVEEPVVPELGAQHLPGLVRCSPVPIATGERLYSRWDFRPVLEAGVAVVQPDLSHAGGISEVRRIAAMAEVYGAALAPHCPLGPIALAASLQVGFTTPNLLIQEQSLDLADPGSEHLDYLTDRTVFGFQGGYVGRPDRPGLGIDIDEDAVTRAAQDGHRWRSPVWRHPDGGHAEW